MKPTMDPANCILVQDVKSVTHDQMTQNSDGPTQLPTEESLPTSTAEHSFTTQHLNSGGGTSGSNIGNGALGNNGVGMSLSQQQSQQQQQQPHYQDPQYIAQQSQQTQQKWPVLELREFNEMYHATIPPFQFWNSEFKNKHPAFIRFNFTLPWGSNFAVYGRRNVAPSVTKYDFAEFIKGGRVDNRLRKKRSIMQLSDQSNNYYEHATEMLADNHNGAYIDTANNGQPIEAESSGAFFSHYVHLTPNEQHMISKRSADDAAPTLDIDTMMVNVSLLQYLDTGRWFLSVYNDELLAHTVTLIVTEAEGVSTTCLNDCSGRGSCYLGKCDCIDGFQGVDCSKSKYNPNNNNIFICRNTRALQWIKIIIIIWRRVDFAWLPIPCRHPQQQSLGCHVLSMLRLSPPQCSNNRKWKIHSQLMRHFTTGWTMRTHWRHTRTQPILTVKFIRQRFRNLCKFIPTFFLLCNVWRRISRAHTPRLDKFARSTCCSVFWNFLRWWCRIIINFNSH